MEARADRLEAQAHERATTTDSSLPFEDEAAPEILGVDDASYPEYEPAHDERITEAIEFGGGDPDDYGDRTFAEIEAVDSGNPWT